MNELGKKSTIQYLGAGLLGFAAILVVGSLTGLHHGAAGPAKVAFSARPANGGGLAGSKPSTPIGLTANTSPRPVVPADLSRAAAEAVALVPSATQTPADSSASAASAPKLAATAHVDMAGSASSSASASAAVAAASKPQAASERKPAFPPKFDFSKNPGTVASSVHYGVSGRSELMGRAAGPVYNFSGGAAKSGGQVAADNATASGAIQQVEKQIDSAAIPADQKAQLHQQLDQAAGAAAPAAP